SLFHLSGNSDSMLIVAGGSSSVRPVQVQTSSTDTGIVLNNIGAGGSAWGLFSSGVNGLGSGKFTIRDDTSGLNRFTIDTGGNVGIGTIAPQAFLDARKG